jgi:hypothetical protein
MDDDLMYQILVALRGALSLFDDSDCSLIISIVISLSSAFNEISLKSKYVKPMFWIALSLIQIGHIAIFSAGLDLMQVVLKRLETLGLFEAQSMSSVLISFRDPITPLLMNLDIAVGIRFVSAFC